MTAPRRTNRERWRDRVIAAVALMTVWVLLWGTLSVGNVIGGLLVAAVILAVFPLPPVRFRGRPRPLGILRFAARFLADLVVASVQLAWTAFRFGYVPRTAIIRVPLRVHSDLNLTLTGEAVSLVPGSLIVDTDQASTTLYVHFFDVSDRHAVERARAVVYEVEARIVRAVGSDAELRRLDAPVTDRKEESP